MKKIEHQVSAAMIVLIAITVFACQPPQTGQEQAKKDVSKVTKAVCVLHPTKGDSASGVVTFEKVDNGIKIDAHMSGLTEGKHGFHIHQWGNCTAEDGTSAGGHFNPDNKKHGGPSDLERHVGDLGNIEADASGNATLTMVDTVIAFEGPHSIIGRGIIVHAGEDDLTSQPTGNAGARVACGVIGIAAEKK